MDNSLRKEIDDMKNRISYLEITIEKLQRESLQHINNNVTVAMQQCCNYYHSSSSDVQSMPAPPPSLPPPPPPPPPPPLLPPTFQLPPYMSTPISKKKDEEKKDKKDLKFAKLHAVTLEELKSVKLRKTGSFLKLNSSCNPTEANEEINNHHLTTPKLKLNLCNISNSYNGEINQSVTQNKEERKNLNFRTILKQLNINKSPGGTPMMQNTPYGDSFTPPAIQVARKLMNSRGLLSSPKKKYKENASDTFEILKF
ncbi:proline-rich protein 11-like [Centruroides vittatus]|uniref:proline-rich protein 11-like n=1 Tax=Centruroides vittatus TaxID=120091 RepID=UPI00350EC326